MALKPNADQLYQAFGELLYAISMVDGEVQEAEAKKIEELLRNHPQAEAIQWSFLYEFKNKISVEEAYQKALFICQHYGPYSDYPFLFDALRQVAAQSEGISPEEKALMERFEGELKAYFLEAAQKEDLA